jgi:hypothetical protein
MPLRQHSGTQALHKTGKTRAATATPLQRGKGADMAVRFMRWLQGLPCEQFTLFHAEIVTAAGDREHRQIIVETTCCARESVRRS